MRPITPFALGAALSCSPACADPHGYLYPRVYSAPAPAAGLTYAARQPACAPQAEHARDLPIGAAYGVRAGDARVYAPGAMYQAPTASLSW